MDSIKLKLSDPLVKQIVNDCYPNYRGRKVRLSARIPRCLDSYWDGGSRNYFRFYDLGTRKGIEVHSNHPFFEANQPRSLERVTLPINVCVVEETIFCGKHLGISIHVQPGNLTPFLPLEKPVAAVTMS